MFGEKMNALLEFQGAWLFQLFFIRHNEIKTLDYVIFDKQIKVKAMSQQQNARANIAQILHNDPSIKLQYLISQFYHQQFSLEDIRRKLSQIELQSNSSHSPQLELKIIGQSASTFQIDQIHEFVLKFMKKIQLQNKHQKISDNVFFPSQQREQTLSKNQIKMDQEQEQQFRQGNQQKIYLEQQDRANNSKNISQSSQNLGIGKQNTQLNLGKQDKFREGQLINSKYGLKAQMEILKNQLDQNNQMENQFQSAPTAQKQVGHLHSEKLHVNQIKLTSNSTQLQKSKITKITPTKSIINAENDIQHELNQLSVLEPIHTLSSKSNSFQVNANKDALFDHADAESHSPKSYPQKRQQSNKNPNQKPQKKHWKSKQPQKNTDNLYDFEMGQPQNVPNFQNQQQLQELTEDQENHKNLFDERGFQIVDEPIEIKRSGSFLSRQFQGLKEKLNRYLIAAYYQYVLQAHSNQNIFDKDQIFRKPLMDLTLFMKFYKDFDLKELLRVNQSTKIFKKQAINHLWVDTQILMQVCYKVIETRWPQNAKEATQVQGQEELIQRANKFIGSFGRDKIKKYFKIQTKDIWNKILEEYKNRQVKQTIEKNHDNKNQIVGKFLQRNFDQHLQKSIHKKDINSQGGVKSRAKLSSNQKQLKKSRDYKTISTSIKKLRSQSEKNIKILKNLFNEKVDKGLSFQMAQKRDYFQSDQFMSDSLNDKSKNKRLGNNKQKNTTASVYREIYQFINQNMTDMKSEKTLLNQQLKINENEPFLNAYFSMELGPNGKINKDKYLDMKDQKISVKKDKNNLLKAGKTNILPSINSNLQNKKFSIEQRVNLLTKANNKNSPTNRQKTNYVRKNTSVSASIDPSGPLIQPKRVHSVKIISVNSKSKKELSLKEYSENANLPVKKVIGQSSKLNQAETDLINKKLYHYLQNNRAQLNNPIDLQIMGSKGKMVSVHESSIIQGQQKYLMQNYGQYVDDLFKNYDKKGSKQDSVLTSENQKRKGYLRNSEKKNASDLSEIRR